MRLLILGGTRFVGRAIVDAALAAEHEVTLFHRGRHQARFGRPVESLHGDRGGDLAGLSGRSWDAVIDTSGYAAATVRASADLLRDAVGRYVFVSTISVYADFRERGITEDSPVQAADHQGTEVTARSYGPMKVGCEQVLAELLPERRLVVRPGIIVGPHDHTDRFPYWCRRVAAGGEVLAPGAPAQPAQWIDARDLGAWLVQALEAGLSGTFNATGPALPSSLLHMLEAMRLATGSDAEFTWVDDAFLRKHGSDPDRDFPFYLPPHETGAFLVDGRRAIAAGLRYRPMEETVLDTLAWDHGRSADERLAGLAAARERQLLHAWHTRRRPD